MLMKTYLHDDNSKHICLNTCNTQKQRLSVGAFENINSRYLEFGHDDGVYNKIILGHMNRGPCTNWEHKRATSSRDRLTTTE